MLHCHITVNGKRVNIPSFLVKAGDKISIREKSREIARVKDSVTGAEGRGALFRKIGRLLHDDASAVLVTELFNVFATKKDIDWEVQQGSGFLNFRRVNWR